MKALNTIIFAFFLVGASNQLKAQLLEGMLHELTPVVDDVGIMNPQTQAHLRVRVANPDGKFVLCITRQDRDSSQVAEGYGEVSCFTEPADPSSPGFTRDVTIYGLEPETKYYFSNVYAVYPSLLYYMQNEGNNAEAIWVTPVSSWTTAGVVTEIQEELSLTSRLTVVNRVLTGYTEEKNTFMVFDQLGRVLKEGVVTGSFNVELPPNSFVVRFGSGKTFKIPRVL
ncbi:MAG: hypothetical protein R3B65_02360 [Candidatus Paceibacterota bacterium]